VNFPTAGTYTLRAKCALACDSGKVVTIKVVVPEPNDVYFVDNVAGEEHDIYNVSDPVWTRVASPDDPASYTMGKKIKVETKFWASDDLTYSTSVNVDANSGDFTFGEDTSVTFQTWPSSKTTHVSDNSLPDTIGSNSVTLTWKYKVPSGTDEWITIANTTGVHKIYRVYGEPLCASSLYTATNLETCVVDWASGCTKVDTSDDANNIPRKVQLGAKIWFGMYGGTPTGIKPDPFTWIPSNKGDCITYADLMTKGLLLLGVSASSEYIGFQSVSVFHRFFTSNLTPYWVTDAGDADGDGTINSSESGWPGTLEGIYVVGSDPTHNAAWRVANFPWNFHGASSCAGHWWEITFYSTPDHDTEANMKAYPNGPVIDYLGWWVGAAH